MNRIDSTPSLRSAQSIGRGVLVLALASTLLAPAPLARDIERPWPWTDWQQLRLKLQGALFLSGSVHFQRSVSPVTQEPSELHISAAARFLGATLARSETTCRLGANGRTSEYIVREPKRGRHYSFTDEQYTVEKLRPSERGLSAPLEEWSRSNFQRFDFPKETSGELTPVQDSYTVLTSLNKLGLDRVGDSATAWIASSRGPQQWRISVEEQARRKVVLKRASGSGKEKLYVTALRLSLTPETKENVDADILGLEGEIELWIEAQSKTLLLLSGKIPRVPGRVSLRLTELS